MPIRFYIPLPGPFVWTPKRRRKARGGEVGPVTDYRQSSYRSSMRVVGWSEKAAAAAREKGQTAKAERLEKLAAKERARAEKIARKMGG